MGAGTNLYDIGVIHIVDNYVRPEPTVVSTN